MSNKKCAVPGCINSLAESKDILHKFPNPEKDRERFNSWLYAVGGDILSLPNQHIHKYRRVCHRHFNEQFWCSGKHLSIIAIPTNYLAEHSVKFTSEIPPILPRIRNATPGESTSKVSQGHPRPQLVAPATISRVEDLGDCIEARNVAPQPKVSQGHPRPQLVAPATISHVEDLGDCFEARNVAPQPKVSQGHPRPQLVAPATISRVEDLGDCFEARNVAPQPKVSQGHPRPQLVAPATISRVEDLGDCFEARNVAPPPKVSQGHPRPQLVAPATISHIEDLGDCFEARNVAPQPKETVTVVYQPDSNMMKKTSQNNVDKNRIMKIREAARKNSAPKLQKKLRKRIAVTKNERKLYNRLLKVGIKLSKSRNKIKRQSAKIKSLKNIATNPYLLKILDHLPSTAKVLTLLQFRENKKKDKGRRFTLQEKIIALSICKQSPKGYRFLRKIFLLPSPQTLVKLINLADIKPGINKNTINQIRKTAENMKTEEKLCVLLFDEMALTANLAYNERKDRVGGFVTDGLKTRAEFADHAQVFMIRGVFKNYKQPVAYTFSQSATKGPELAVQLKTVITELQDAGLIVVATVCDQGTNNTQCLKILTQEARGTLLRKGKVPRDNVILINDQEIVPLYDPPHLIKCIRNNLVTKDLTYLKDGKTATAKWAHIIGLHNENPGYKGIRLVPKLTDLHCLPTKIPKMKVKYATQVFSQTVASNMGYLADKRILPIEAKETADILIFFDRLFDSVNGSFAKKNRYAKPLLGPVTPTSPHHKAWFESKKLLKDMLFVHPLSKKRESVPTLRNWVWTLEGMEVLLKNLKTTYDITSVWLRHLNQDPIENFFGSIRSHGCRNVHPTAEKFQSAYTTLLINSLSGMHAPGANCETDCCALLQETMVMPDVQETNMDTDINFPDITITPLVDKSDPRIIGGLQYVTGYFLKSAKRNIFKKCKQCVTDLTTRDEITYLKYREYANKKWLHYPSNDLLTCVSCLQDIHSDVLKTNLEMGNLKEFIKTMVLIHVEFEYIKCEEHKEKLIDYLINISSRFFIHNYCKDINRILTHRRHCEDEGDFYQVKAKTYARKTLKRKHSSNPREYNLL